MKYSIKIKIIKSTTQEKQEYNKVIRWYQTHDHSIRRPDWNFAEWLVHKRYVKQGWKYPKTWQQESYMTCEQLVPFAKYQGKFYGIGKPDFFFYKLKGNSLKNKFVEVKFGSDSLNKYQKYFISEFTIKRKIFDIELVYVLKDEETFYPRECVCPPTKTKKPNFMGCQIKSLASSNFLCLASLEEDTKKKEVSQQKSELKKYLTEIAKETKQMSKKEKETQDWKMLRIWERETRPVMRTHQP